MVAQIHRRRFPMLSMAIGLFIMLWCSVSTIGRPAMQDDGQDAAIAAIKSTIHNAYVEGWQRQRDPDLIREGFASTFVMQIRRDEGLSSIGLDDWLARGNFDKTPNPRTITAEIDVLDVTGHAATARAQVYRDGERRFIDYFGLYRVDERWMIVTKHFHRH